MRFHFFYMAIISFLGYQFISQKQSFSSSHHTLGLIGAQLKSDAEILRVTNSITQDEINKITHINPRYKIYQDSTQLIRSTTRNCINLIDVYCREFMYYCGGWDSLQNTIKKATQTTHTAQFFNNDKMNTLRDSLNKLSTMLLSSDNDFYNQNLALPRLLKDDTYWQQLKDLTHESIYTELYRIINLILVDENRSLNYMFTQVGTCYRSVSFDMFKLGIAPKKAALIEGESFEGDIFIVPYSSLSNWDRPISAVVNGLSVPLINGVGHYVSTPQSLGKKTLKATLSTSDNSYLPISEYEYEVIPQCKKSCQ